MSVTLRGLYCKKCLPFKPAFFSARRPKPSPELMFDSGSATLVFSLPPVNKAETKPLWGLANWGRTSETFGRTPFACSFQLMILLFAFAFSLKSSPKNMFTHPSENKKNAETRVKSSTW